jgi:phosphate starvation-inducible PhoH-like protein
LSRASGSRADGNEPAPLYITFDDNGLLSTLFGEHDSHLARIEQKLGVSISSRGNRLAISGRPSDGARAKKVLTELYDLLRSGVPVGLQEVDAALRMSDRVQSTTDVARLSPGETVIATPKRQILPRSTNQAAYVRALYDSPLVFGVGPAGTGKTYLAAAVAVSMLSRGQVDRIVLSRPAVEAGERLGFLPGDMREKVDPYLRPLYDALYDLMPGDRVMDRLESGEIEIAPLAFMRGRTLSNAFVILDEAQNTTSVQMKMFLTRLGENSRMAVTGDQSQIDLPSRTLSGLNEALAVTKNIKGVEVVRFGADDVVRHELVTAIVRAYEAHEDGKAPRGAPSDEEPPSDGEPSSDGEP